MKNSKKCEFRGCKKTASWQARKLFGDGGTLCACDDHKPDASKRPAKLQHLPFFYEVMPLEQS